MESIGYLILGSLITVVGYLLHKNNKLTHYNHINYRTISRLLLQDEKHDKDILEVHYLLGKLDQQMKEDSYKSISETNQNLSDNIDNLKALTQTFNSQDLAIQESFGTIAQNFQNINKEIFLLKSHIENNIN